MTPVWSLLDSDIPSNTGHEGQLQAGDQAQDRTEEDDELLCSVCMSPITRLSLAVSINGSWEHTQINPHGFMYTISCYLKAPGCIAEPPSSAEFAWFAGYEWTIATCRHCHHHLGWQFEGAGLPNQFFGLIANRLIAKQ